MDTELWATRKAILERVRHVRDVAEEQKDKMHLSKVILFGSVARGTCDYLSDVDILFVVDGGHEIAGEVEDYILGELYEDFDGIEPRIDAHTCSTSIFDSDNSQIDSTPFGDFLDCIKREGILIWKR